MDKAVDHVDDDQQGLVVFFSEKSSVFISLASFLLCLLFIITKFSNDENEIVGFCRVFSLHGEFVIPMISSLTFIIAEGAKKLRLKAPAELCEQIYKTGIRKDFLFFAGKVGYTK